ncbi:helicase associated domain-containing protein [Kitasatospora sp. NPDC088783]|uniref:helicase associated domain-containing protein n=1 Tax=Kitasatospora sp. NPDC088783 TaxID=3364077 RepID=UPI003824E2CD
MRGDHRAGGRGAVGPDRPRRARPRQRGIANAARSVGGRCRSAWPSPSAPGPRTERAALAVFVEREGHVQVSRAHKEGEVALGAWLNNQKARRDKLSVEQLGQLEALGVAW